MTFLNDVKDRLGTTYRIVEQEYFLWLSPFGVDHLQRAKHAHYALRRIYEVMPWLEPPEKARKWPAIFLASTDDLFAYEGLFDGSGTSIIHGGCWRRWPVGHLAIPVVDWDALDAAFGHELIHALLDGTGVPVWLQEGITTEYETRIGNRSPPLRDLYNWGQTLAYWRSHDFADFWSGRAFHDPVSSSHSYSMAQVIGYRWTSSPKWLNLAQRIPQAEWKNEAAALAEHF